MTHPGGWTYLGRHGKFALYGDLQCGLTELRADDDITADEHLRDVMGATVQASMLLEQRRTRTQAAKPTLSEVVALAKAILSDHESGSLDVEGNDLCSFLSSALPAMVEALTIRAPNSDGSMYELGVPETMQALDWEMERPRPMQVLGKDGDKLIMSFPRSSVIVTMRCEYK